MVDGVKDDENPKRGSHESTVLEVIVVFRFLVSMKVGSEWHRLRSSCVYVRVCSCVLRKYVVIPEFLFLVN